MLAGSLRSLIYTKIPPLNSASSPIFHFCDTSPHFSRSRQSRPWYFLLLPKIFSIHFRQDFNRNGSAKEYQRLESQSHAGLWCDLPPKPSEIRWCGGSHVTEKELLALRCYWQVPSTPTASIADSDARGLDIHSQWGPAKRWLNAYPPFRAYLDHVKSNGGIAYWDVGDSEKNSYELGIMEIPRKTQQMIDAAVRGQNPRDEQMVIASLVSFLQSITIANRAVRCDWSSQRKYFNANFGGSSLRLFADGVLVDRATNDIKVLLEAKRTRGNDKRLSWQVDNPSGWALWGDNGNDNCGTPSEKLIVDQGGSCQAIPGDYKSCHFTDEGGIQIGLYAEKDCSGDDIGYQLKGCIRPGTLEKAKYFKICWRFSQKLNLDWSNLVSQQVSIA